jgi:hypothetical protein
MDKYGDLVHRGAREYTIHKHAEAISGNQSIEVDNRSPNYHEGTIGAMGTACLSVVIHILEELEADALGATLVPFSPYAQWRRHMPVGLRGAYEARYLMRPGRHALKALMRVAALGRKGWEDVKNADFPVPGAVVYPSEHAAWRNYIARGFADLTTDGDKGGGTHHRPDACHAPGVEQSPPLQQRPRRAFRSRGVRHGPAHFLRPRLRQPRGRSS